MAVVRLENNHIVRDERALLDPRVQHIRGTVIGIDTQKREVQVRHRSNLDEIVGTGGAVKAAYGYDYLVLATGARLVPEDLSELDEADSNHGWHHFYSAEAALQLRQALHFFEGGRIVITEGGIPYRCLPAPLEFTFLLLEGEEIPYDLLVLVPPHRGARVIEESGLGDAQGWITLLWFVLRSKSGRSVLSLCACQM